MFMTICSLEKSKFVLEVFLDSLVSNLTNTCKHVDKWRKRWGENWLSIWDVSIQMEEPRKTCLRPHAARKPQFAHHSIDQPAR